MNVLHMEKIIQPGEKYTSLSACVGKMLIKKGRIFPWSGEMLHVGDKPSNVA